MMNQEAQAAGQGGTPSKPEPETAQETSTLSPADRAPAPPDSPPETPQREAAQAADDIPDDETQRRRIADRLADFVDIGAELALVCERRSGPPKKDRTDSAAHAVAHLTQANAQLGRTLAQLLKVERRQTTIVHRTQPLASSQGYSNSNGAGLTDIDAELIDGVYRTMLQYMKLIADEELGTAVDPEARKEKYAREPWYGDDSA